MRRGRRARIGILALLGVCSACYGDKVLVGAGGAGAGATTSTGGSTTSDGGSTTGNGGSTATNSGGAATNGGGGEGGTPVSVCTPENEGASCDDGSACSVSKCISSTCTFAMYEPAGTYVQDDAQAGDCKAIVCTGSSGDPSEGNYDGDVPLAPDCHVGQCNGGVPSLSAAPLGTMCTTGVCASSGSCVACLSWANCNPGKVCNTFGGSCVDCTSNASCQGNPAGKQCKSGTCGCITGSYCGDSPAGGRCINNTSCGCISDADCQSKGFGPTCDLLQGTCGCQVTSQCLSSEVGKQCVGGRCGCNTSADCGSGSSCDVSQHVCV